MLIKIIRKKKIIINKFVDKKIIKQIYNLIQITYLYLNSSSVSNYYYL